MAKGLSVKVKVHVLLIHICIVVTIPLKKSLSNYSPVQNCSHMIAMRNMSLTRELPGIALVNSAILKIFTIISIKLLKQ